MLLQAIRSGYVRHVPKTMMEFEANPDFYKGKPEIERVVLKFGPDTPLLELLSGKVDAAGFAPTQIPGLGEDPRFRVYYSERNDNWAQWIFWNQRHPLFHDPVVRRALTLAINRRELLEVLNFPPDLPIFDVLFTRPQYRQRQLPEPLPYDPELAKQLLEAAGWQDEDGDGIRERAGAEARFTLIANRQSTVDLGERAAVYVQDQLRGWGSGWRCKSWTAVSRTSACGPESSMPRSTSFLDIGSEFSRAIGLARVLRLATTTSVSPRLEQHRLQLELLMLDTLNKPVLASVGRVNISVLYPFRA